MTSTQIAQTEIRNLLAAAGGDYVAAYDRLVSQANENAIYEEQRSTSSARKLAWRSALARRDRGQLRKAYETMRSYVKLAKTNSDIVEQDPSVLSPAESRSLMQQFIDLRNIEVMVKADREAIKDRVFASMTEELAAKGEEFPENTNASIDVTDLGYRFDRYGAGRYNPELDEATLRESLGEDVWDKVTRLEIIPEQKIRTLDYGLLIQVAHNHPELAVLEKVRGALILGAWKKPSFTIRPLKDQKEG